MAAKARFRRDCIGKHGGSKKVFKGPLVSEGEGIVLSSISTGVQAFDDSEAPSFRHISVDGIPSGKDFCLEFSILFFF